MYVCMFVCTMCTNEIVTIAWLSSSHCFFWPSWLFVPGIIRSTSTMSFYHMPWHVSEVFQFAWFHPSHAVGPCPSQPLSEPSHMCTSTVAHRNVAFRTCLCSRRAPCLVSAPPSCVWRVFIACRLGVTDRERCLKVRQHTMLGDWGCSGRAPGGGRCTWRRTMKLKW